MKIKRFIDFDYFSVKENSVPSKARDAGMSYMYKYKNTDKATVIPKSFNMASFLKKIFNFFKSEGFLVQLHSDNNKITGFVPRGKDGITISMFRNEIEVEFSSNKDNAEQILKSYIPDLLKVVPNLEVSKLESYNHISKGGGQGAILKLKPKEGTDLN
jgi:hypothetical protein